MLKSKLLTAYTMVALTVLSCQAVWAGSATFPGPGSCPVPGTCAALLPGPGVLAIIVAGVLAAIAISRSRK